MIDDKSSETARDMGIQRALFAEESYIIERAITWAARNHAEITSDHVWEYLEFIGIDDLDKPNAMGAMFRVAASCGIIKSTRRTTKTKHVAGHSRTIMIWKSLVYKGAKA